MEAKSSFIKKAPFGFFATLFAVTVLILFLSSCESSLEEITPTEEVKIFMSGVVTSDAPMKAPGENSGEQKRTAIANGDTIDVYNVKDINLIMMAETEYGFPIEGQWGLSNVKTDLKYDSDVFVANLPGGGFNGPNMSIKLSQLGLYAVYFFPKSGAGSVMFYIRHTGTPGNLGDDWNNDWIFRMEKVKYQIVNTTYTGYTLYLKYKNLSFNYYSFPNDETSEMNPASEENWKALLFCKGKEFITETGEKLSAKEFQLRKCEYSEDYVCFSFLEQDCPSIYGEYAMYFYSGKWGWNWWSFPAVGKSNWEKNGRIVFKVI